MYDRHRPLRADHPALVNAVLVRVPAGFPSPAQDSFDDGRIDLNEILIGDVTSTFALRVTGDSMLGCGIHDGDELLVDRSITPRDGDVVIAVVDGDFTFGPAGSKRPCGATSACRSASGSHRRRPWQKMCTMASKKTSDTGGVLHWEPRSRGLLGQADGGAAGHRGVGHRRAAGQAPGNHGHRDGGRPAGR